MRASFRPCAGLLVACTCLGWFLTGPALSGIFRTRLAPIRCGASVLAVPPRGSLGDALFKQGLSHAVFHEGRAKSRLASLVAPQDGAKDAVAVVGVEYGGEVLMFAKEGYAVQAFEPMPKYYNLMAEKIRMNVKKATSGSEPRWDVRLHQVAAGAEANGTYSLTYGKNEQTTVRVGRIDDYVRQEVGVLSIDIQGSEIDALRGATNLINDGNVRSLWIEIFSCNKRVLEVLHLLDEKFVIFDFVPWGQTRNASGALNEETTSLDKHPSFLTVDGAERPPEFFAFWQWMCSKHEKNKGPFAWLQSDVLAIRRDLVTPELMVKLSTLSHDLFWWGFEEERVAERARQREILLKNSRIEPGK